MKLKAIESRRHHHHRHSDGACPRPTGRRSEFVVCAVCYFFSFCLYISLTFSLFETHCRSAFFHALCKVSQKHEASTTMGAWRNLTNDVVTEVRICFLFSHRLLICVECLFVCACLRLLVDCDSSGEESGFLTPFLSILADSPRNSTWKRSVQHMIWVLWRKIAVLLWDPTHLAPELLNNLLFWWY